MKQEMTAKTPGTRANQRKEPQSVRQNLAALPTPVMIAGIVGGVVVVGLGLALVAYTGGTMHLTSNGLTFIMRAS